MKKGVFLVCLILFLLGWFANDFFLSKQTMAAKPFEYKVVSVPWDTTYMQKTLNTNSKEGWKLHSFYSTILIFEK